MVNDCSRLMKDALDNYLGIDMRYKLDDTLASLGKQKFSAKQLEGYLLKKGVSPKEIKQSGIFEGMADDNRAISADDWLSMSGRQKITKDYDHDYADITLGRKGEEPGSDYIVTTSFVKPTELPTATGHFDYSEYIDDLGHTTANKTRSLLGWRRTHVDDIDGKKTLVLNEIQSDWAQAERAKAGIFESSIDSSKKGETRGKVLADFPMAEIKHNQFQIVGAIDEALKQGIDTIVIPIQRQGELGGTAGVTKFYESLNKKVLPDIRKKLEKQGMRIKVDKAPYKEENKSLNLDSYLLKDIDNTLQEDFQNFTAGEALDSIRQIQSKPWFKDFEQSEHWPFNTTLADHPGVMEVPNEVVNDLYAGLQRFHMQEDLDGVIKKLVTEDYHRLTPEAKNEVSLDELLSMKDYQAMHELLTNVNWSFDNSIRLNPELYEAIEATKPQSFWRLTVEEIPNKKVNWDVYGLVGALGLTSMLSGDAEAKELPNIVSPKTEQVESQVPRTRAEAEQGILQNILSQNKVAPINEPKGILQQYKEMGLISQEEEDSYGFKKDDTILDDYRVNMKREMPKTIQEQEGNNLSAHRPTKRSGWTIGRGYDLTGRKLENVIADFKEAGISEGQARAFFKHKPIKINAKQSKALGDIAWREKVDTARRIGLPVDKLNREGFLKVMSLVYRGDIVKGDSGYRGKLYDLAKKGDIKAIDRFVLNDSVKTLKSNVLYNRWKKFNKS